ncbi:MAG: tRNA pseudouridine(55) synthase TruB [Alphaproteobacteria bacterium]|nr:tRNA pseudouridine(55) synthase TruB [Rhodospirillales bacterium]MCW9046123.1 tRNA pseudouridine(55) synthase TruB [Alphaproteobacteria bacterium]
MGRKRKGLPIHGWIAIDKPLEMTSNQVVGAVRRFTQAAKVGHGGTLDPLATGILPIALGEATKTVSYAMDGSKEYCFTVKWGEATETDDTEGEVTEQSNVRPTEDQIKEALSGFIGEIEQTPPIYSAIKVNGERAYALARADKEVTLKSRIVRVDEFELVKCLDESHAEFRVSCGKGVYVRALGRDLALKLGTFGHIVALRRTRVGPFDEKMAISLDKLSALGNSAPSENWLLPVETALDDIPALALTEEEARTMHNGQGVSLLHVATRFPDLDLAQDSIVCAMASGKLLALARITGGEIRPVRVMNM